MYYINDVKDCDGLSFHHPRMVSVCPVDNQEFGKEDHVILQTDFISHCVGIGVIVKNPETSAIKQMSLHHSISEHGFHEDKEYNHKAGYLSSMYLLSRYNEFSQQERKSILQGKSDERSSSDGRYFACSWIEMLSSTKPKDEVLILLQIGCNTYLEPIESHINQWCQAYKELKQIELDIKIEHVENPNQSGYFAIDIDARSYTNKNDLKENCSHYDTINFHDNVIFLKELFTIALGITDGLSGIETQEISFNGQSVIAPKELSNIYQTYQAAIEIKSNEKINAAGDKLINFLRDIQKNNYNKTNYDNTTTLFADETDNQKKISSKEAVLGNPS
ncbi:hypothetical protein L3V82_07175 [Thiotrichales bacterium 19S3-7]|nr:hypothetical protein [Thiotrichales bacterium 19S3-7]MCF6801940.1 hypothetical protein [Thiotrichales bacterium 19S3-11]